MYEIRTRDVPEQLVLTEQRHVTADKLPDFIMEAGGRQYEAFTGIAKAQVRYPDILSADDAVETWISGNGEHVAGPPREACFFDMMEAADDDEVVDIAFPIV